MLFNGKDSDYQSYGFQIEGAEHYRVASMFALGREYRTNADFYSWNGTVREEKGIVIFQYTLKGRGKIDINDRTYHLKPGDAFFVYVPGDHHYYLPLDSNKWEFIFVTTYGEEAKKCYEIIKNKHGQVFHLDTYTPPVQYAFFLLNQMKTNTIKDKYELSAHAYSFLMNLLGYMENTPDSEWPESVLKAVSFIHENYMKPLSLDDIVQHVQISKYYFTKLFYKYIHTTPMKYVTKIQIKNSMPLLRDNQLTIEEIAYEVGFANGNYFSKVFRNYIGVSPGKYKSGKSMYSFDNFITF